ncbi:MAG: PilT/PilU family type 4a pilus ATPase [Candidatus Hydrogenedentes bacterium]|nr:PilT/PilU family type 4a pilus ATPase [Candidatus Hydrogenedentota bacterium]
MPEFVIGTGNQKSARNVVRMIEKHLLRTEGVPRTIRARAPGLLIIAERPEFKVEFNKFTFEFTDVNGQRTLVDPVVKQYTESCELAQENGCLRVSCPPSGAQPDDRSLEAVDKLSAVIRLPETWRAEGDNYRVDRISIEMLFQAMIQYKASDVHLSPGFTPVFRIDNDTRVSDLLGSLSAVQIRELIREVAPDEYWREFEEHKQSSFNFHQVGLGYARISCFIKSAAPHCTFRFLPEKIPSFEDLNIPRGPLEKLASLHRGLLLVTGMTGSGKSTTVASLVDWINSHQAGHILTIENPIEYVHVNKKSIISQRGLGVDVETFNAAVTGALRHDPDVIVIGEMRDPDTIRAAINAAATGHLVISTLHANTASEVVNRIVSFFDPIERDLVKLQLRDCVQCIICQRLVARIGGGRLPALEFMFPDIKAIRDGILAGDTDAIRIGMQQTVSHSILFEQYLHNLYKQGDITLEHARDTCTDESVFDQLNMGTYSVPRLDSIKHHFTA